MTKHTISASILILCLLLVTGCIPEPVGVQDSPGTSGALTDPTPAQPGPSATPGESDDEYDAGPLGEIADALCAQTRVKSYRAQLLQRGETITPMTEAVDLLLPDSIHVISERHRYVAEYIFLGEVTDSKIQAGDC